jgi:hypothetical protein
MICKALRKNDLQGIAKECFASIEIVGATLEEACSKKG